MKRRNFIKTIIGAVGLAAVPKVIANEPVINGFSDIQEPGTPPVQFYEDQAKETLSEPIIDDGLERGDYLTRDFSGYLTKRRHVEEPIIAVYDGSQAEYMQDIYQGLKDK